MQKLKSLLNINEILTNPDYTNNLENFLLSCENEYKKELKKERNIQQIKEQMINKIQDNNKNKTNSNLKIEHVKKVDTAKNTKKILNVDNYYNDLLQVTELDELEIILPEKNKSNFSKIINLLILRLLKDINEYYYLFKMEQNDDEKEKLEQTICNLNEKKDWLVLYRDYEEEIIEENSITPKPTYLIFMKNTYGNFTIEADFKKITTNEYNLDILNCLETLKNNTHKTYKTFTKKQDGTLSGVSELWANPRCRIIYDRYENTEARFIFISSIIQKNTINSYYKIALENRNNQFKNFKQKFINLLENNSLDEIVKEHEELFSELTKTIKEGVKYVRTIK